MAVAQFFPVQLLGHWQFLVVHSVKVHAEGSKRCMVFACVKRHLPAAVARPQMSRLHPPCCSLAWCCMHSLGSRQMGSLLCSPCCTIPLRYCLMAAQT